ALDQRHVDEQPAVDLAVAVDRDDVGSGQPRGKGRLATETMGEVLVPPEPRTENLERDDAVALAGVDGSPDLAHAAAAEQRLEPVRPERFSGHARPPAAVRDGRPVDLAMSAERAEIVPVEAHEWRAHANLLREHAFHAAART